jgi:hypothetical protein
VGDLHEKACNGAVVYQSLHNTGLTISYLVADSEVSSTVPNRFGPEVWEGPRLLSLKGTESRQVTSLS